jgi:hypothetical protein
MDGLLVGESYRKLVDEARYERGHGTYSGTIATTSGCRIVGNTAMTATGAAALAEWADDQRCCDELPKNSKFNVADMIATKGGYALAIRVAEDRAFNFKKITFTLGLDDLGDAAVGSEKQLWLAFHQRSLEEAMDRFGFAVHRVEAKVDVKVRISVSSAAGKAKMRWQADGGFPRWNRSFFNTKTQAVAYAKEVVAENPAAAISIRRVAVHEPQNGTDPTLAAQVRAVPVTAKAKVTVTVATPKTRVSKDVGRGWLFYGVAVE